MKKFFRRILSALLIVACMVTASLVGATVKMYTATAEDYASEVESQDIAKLRARDKAIKKATKEAGVYLKTYSRSVDSELTDDEVTAITSNSWQLVGEPKYTRTVKQLSDETPVIVWTATVEVNVDDAELQSWLKRDDKDKSTIITQTREAQKSSDENERKVEDLRERYNQATSQAERDEVRQQIDDADRDFLANQKNEDGLKLYYAKNFNGAIRLYNEAIQLNPNLAKAYNNRGFAYFGLGQDERAIADFDKSIQLNPNEALAYYNRGVVYGMSGNFEQAIVDVTKAIELNPNDAKAYQFRGLNYHCVNNYERAIQDYTKAIQLNPNDADTYINRGNAYYYLKQCERAIADFDKAIQFGIDGKVLGETLYYRGLCYQATGDEAKAQADFAKAKQLGFNG